MFKMTTTTTTTDAVPSASTPNGLEQEHIDNIASASSEQPTASTTSFQLLGPHGHLYSAIEISTPDDHNNNFATPVNNSLCKEDTAEALYLHVNKLCSSSNPHMTDSAPQDQPLGGGQVLNDEFNNALGGVTSQKSSHNLGPAASGSHSSGGTGGADASSMQVPSGTSSATTTPLKHQKGSWISLSERLRTLSSDNNNNCTYQHGLPIAVADGTGPVASSSSVVCSTTSQPAWITSVQQPSLNAPSVSGNNNPEIELLSQVSSESETHRHYTDTAPCFPPSATGTLQLDAAKGGGTSVADDSSTVSAGDFHKQSTQMNMVNSSRHTTPSGSRDGSCDYLFGTKPSLGVSGGTTAVDSNVNNLVSMTGGGYSPPQVSQHFPRYLKVNLPYREYARKARLEGEVYQAVKSLTSVLYSRDIFIAKWDEPDSEVVFQARGAKDWTSTEPVFRPYDCPRRENVSDGYLSFEDGVFTVRTATTAISVLDDDNAADVEGGLLHDGGEGSCDEFVCIPSVSKYLEALTDMMAVVVSPICKSLAYQRLKYLEQKFSLHLLFNGAQEIAETRTNGHRDFYNVRKVDTHVHHSACMHQKHLLRFIRRKYKTEGDTVVAKGPNNNPITLAEIFTNELKLSPHEISIDHLNVHALNSCFHRFDLFNSKYNPFGAACLREVFLKTDNLIGGRYLAELTQEVIRDLEEKKYQHCEYRVSIYGKSRDEWKKLAWWMKRHDLFSSNVRWMIQVPRLYHIYRKLNLVSSMGELLRNVFEPVFEAVLRPEDNPEIYELLFQVTGWDSVDDESIMSKFSTAGGNIPPPDLWVSDENPPYAYWMYYMYANIRSLNNLLRWRNMRPMMFRPHCGEAGSISHLASCYLLADGINHGLTLKKSPVLSYLYFLQQIGLAMSPLSNNALFHEISKSPFEQFFKLGLNVSLSSDDPLMFHFTDEPLLEEYGVCAHLWKLSTVDLCEIARNGVLQSSYEVQFKRHWLGAKYSQKGVQGNDVRNTNVPNIRIQYRDDTLKEEFRFLRDVLLCGGVTSSSAAVTAAAAGLSSTDLLLFNNSSSP